MRQIIFHPYVQRDIDGALGYYSEKSKHLEERFWNEFCRAIYEIEERPEKQHFD